MDNMSTWDKKNTLKEKYSSIKTYVFKNAIRKRLEFLGQTTKSTNTYCVHLEENE